MKRYYSALTQLETELDKVAITTPNVIEKCEKSNSLISKTIFDVKTRVLNEGFKNSEDEIFFFKKIKSKLFSHLLYYTGVLNLELHRPFALKEEEKSFLVNELYKLQSFFDHNREFYNYYKRGDTRLDEYYFSSGEASVVASRYAPVIIDDPMFLSKHGVTVALIICNEKLINYINTELNILGDEQYQIQEFGLFWSGQKNALVELIYALYLTNVINNGKADIKQIKRFFEQAFNIDLGNIYRTFVEIQSRKENPVKFINELAINLEDKIEESNL